MEFTTLFINKTKAPWYIPKGIYFSEGQQVIAPLSSFEFHGDEAGIYSRYRQIILSSKLNDEGVMTYEIKCDRNKDWTPPARRGWTLVIQNETGSPLSSYSYRAGGLSLQCPAGIEVELYNVNPSEYLAQFKKIERTEEVVRRWADPRVSSGFRETIEGGTFKCIPRDEEQLLEIELQRARLAAHALMPALAAIEQQKILDEKA